MEAQDYQEQNPQQSLNEEPAVYASREALEEARLREAINRSDTEKFQFLMTLMKMNLHMNKAVIHHKKGY